MSAWAGVCRVWPRVFKAAEFFAIIVALITFAGWLSECEDRAIERRYRAWELINGAAYLPGDGGRSDALENLAKDGRSLAGAVLDFAHLPGINLGSSKLSGQRVDLSRASMRDAQLYGADLEGAVLDGADLTGADLSSSLSCPGTDYRWSSIDDTTKVFCEKPDQRRTNLKDASLTHAKLHGAHLINADLTEASLIHAVLGDADLKGADLTGASLTYAVLDGADLKGADLTCAGLDWVDLGRAKGLEAAQLKNALGGRRTTLPQYLEFEPPCYWSEYGSVEEGCAKPNCPRR